MVFTTYGRSSGFCVDPIEKKSLFHFLPGMPVLSFGTAGCDLVCRFCQNWDISKARAFDRLQKRAMAREIAAVAHRTGRRSVAYTYNDPVIFLEYVLDTAAACRERGIRDVAVTAGHICAEPRREFFVAMDAANVDLKAFDEAFYRRICGGRLRPVPETLEYVKHQTDCRLEITTLLIPGLNDSNAEIEALSRWVVERLGPDVPLHFTAFHPDWRMRDVPPTSASTLRRGRRIASEVGLRYVYLGVVHGDEGESTSCHLCGEKLVGRDRYRITAWNLDANGCCRRCGTPLPGLFEERSGDRGARRLPVRIGADG